MSDLLQLAPLSLYVHMPWCVRKCPYCDFNSHELKQTIPERNYIDALIEDVYQELDFVQNRSISSVFIGGGTPSLFSAESIARLLSELDSLIGFQPDTEITLEANPGAIEANKFIDFKQVGINRLSIGIQSFHDVQLKKLGRIHNCNEALRAVELVHSAGFKNFNLDLMFGLPDQILDTAMSDVQICLESMPAHISYYQLTLEPNTFFSKFPPKLPDCESTWNIQQAGHQQLKARGYQQYEISGFSKKGYQCQHNLNYWQFGDYLGIGAGAHGKITDIRTGKIHRYWKKKQPTEYMAKASKENRLGGQSILVSEDLPFEFLMNNLRLKEGFNESLFESRTGLGIFVLEPELSNCIADGLLEKNYNNIRCSEIGWNFLDEVLQRFYPRKKTH